MGPGCVCGRCSIGDHGSAAHSACRAPRSIHHRRRERPARLPQLRCMKPDERGFEDAITTSLVEVGGYRVCKWGTKPGWAGDFNPKLGLDTSELLAFIE